MQFRFDPEHDELRRTVRRFLADVAAEEVVRRDMATVPGWSAQTWRRLCDELELASLAVPEEYGGAGFGLVELGVVLTEAGRALLCAPLLSTSIATLALLRAAELDAGAAQLAAAHLPALAGGETTGTLAAREPGRAWDAPPATTATLTPAAMSAPAGTHTPAPGSAPGGDGRAAGDGAGGWTLTGVKDWVLDGHTAQLLIVTASAKTPGADAAGTSLFLVDAGAPGLEATPLDAVDPTRRAARVTFEAVPAVPLGTPGSGGEALRRTLDAAIILLAAEQVGVAQACLDAATAYARAREQFGRPIGSFQAIKHKLADVLLETEGAAAAAMYALWAADRRPEELPEVARIAAAVCSDAALLAAGENVQVHGGMGVTWEHPAHLYLKRATTSRLLFGDPQHHLERLASLTGISAPPAGAGVTPPGAGDVHPPRPGPAAARDVAAEPVGTLSGAAAAARGAAVRETGLRNQR